MPTLITGERLRAALSPEGFIRKGDLSCVEGAKYDFRLSSLILKSSYGRPIDVDKLPEEQKANLTIEPGEIVFVRTLEEVDLPNNVMALLSPKRKMSHNGILVLCGFCVDPRYRGPLWIGLYNFSSTPFPIEPKRKIIAALFYELTERELMEFPVPESSGQSDFPHELVLLIRNYKPTEIKALIAEVADTKRRLDLLASELSDDKTWRKDFKDSLETHNRQLGQLIDGLREEKEARAREDERLRTDVSRLEQQVSGFWTTLTSSFKIGWVIVAFLVGTIIAAILTYAVTTAIEANTRDAARRSAYSSSRQPIATRHWTRNTAVNPPFTSVS